MSHLTLTDWTGIAVPLGPVEMQPSERMGVQVRVARQLSAGRYTISWTTAGPDGHPTRGSFAFMVVEAMAQGTGRAMPNSPNRLPNSSPGATTVSSAMSVTSPVHVVARALEFAALLAIIGAVVFRFAVVPRAGAIGTLDMPYVSSRSAGLAAVAALALIASAVLRLVLQIRMMRAMGVIASPGALITTHWGRALVYQLLVAMIGLVGFLIGKRGARSGWILAAIAATALAVSPAMGGHAAAAATSATLSTVVDALHVVGAAGWLGTLLFVLAVGVPLSVGAGKHWKSVAIVIEAFSPVALAFGALTAATGIASAWLRLGSLGALTGTSYGRVLIVKLLLLGGLAVMGAYNWRRVKPTLGTAEATGRLRTLGSVELAIGCAIVLVTATLVALPAPTSTP